MLKETGYSRDLRVLTAVVDCAYSTRVKYACLATNCRRVRAPERTPTEHGDVVLVPLDRFRGHLRSGRLTDVAAGYLGLDALGLL